MTVSMLSLLYSGTRATLTVKVGRDAALLDTLSATDAAAEEAELAASSTSSWARTRAAHPRAKRGAVTRMVLHRGSVNRKTR